MKGSKVRVGVLGPPLRGFCLPSLTPASFAPHRLCGSYPPSYNMTFISSQNVLLVTLITNTERRHPGFEAVFFQLPKMNSKEGRGGGRGRERARGRGRGRGGQREKGTAGSGGLARSVTEVGS